MMTRLLPLIAALMLTTPAWATRIEQPLWEITGSAYNAPVKITSGTNAIVADGAGLVPGPSKLFTPSAGVLTISNLVAGPYVFEQGGKSFRFTVTNSLPTITNSLLELAPIGVTYSTTQFPLVSRLTNDDGSITISPASGQGVVTVRGTGSSTNGLATVEYVLGASNSLSADIAELTGGGVTTEGATTIAAAQSLIVSNGLSGRLVATNAALVTLATNIATGVVNTVWQPVLTANTNVIVVWDAGSAAAVGTYYWVSGQTYTNADSDTYLDVVDLHIRGFDDTLLYQMTSLSGDQRADVGVGGLEPGPFTSYGSNVTRVASAPLGGDGASITNLDGANIQSGTINSNAFDTATRALLGTGGGITTNDVVTLLSNGVPVIVAEAFNVGNAGLTFISGGGIRATSAVAVTVEAGSKNTLVVTNGMVGVGTSSPSVALDVSGGVRASGLIRSDTGFYSNGSIIAGAGQSIGHDQRNRWYSSASGEMRWTDNTGTTRLMANTNGTLYVPTNVVGKVGVGITPTVPLEVSGESVLRGNVTVVGGNLKIGVSSKIEFSNGSNYTNTLAHTGGVFAFNNTLSAPIFEGGVFRGDGSGLTNVAGAGGVSATTVTNVVETIAFPSAFKKAWGFHRAAGSAAFTSIGTPSPGTQSGWTTLNGVQYVGIGTTAVNGNLGVTTGFTLSTNALTPLSFYWGGRPSDTNAALYWVVLGSHTSVPNSDNGYLNATHAHAGLVYSPTHGQNWKFISYSPTTGLITNDTGVAVADKFFHIRIDATPTNAVAYINGVARATNSVEWGAISEAGILNGMWSAKTLEDVGKTNWCHYAYFEYPISTQ